MNRVQPYRQSAPRPSEEERPLGELLGDQVSEHRPPHGIVWHGLGAALGLAVIVLALTGFRNWLLFLVALVVPVTITAVCVSVSMWRSPRRVAVHERGIVVERWFRASTHVAFDACRSVFYDYDVSSTSFAGPRVTGGALRLESAGGTVIKLHSSLRDAATMFAEIDRVCLKPVTSEAVRAYQAGEVLRFGPIEISAAGLTIRGEPKEWSDVRKVQMSPKGFWFRYRGYAPYGFVPFHKVPYPFALFTLLETHGCEVELIEGFVRP